MKTLLIYLYENVLIRAVYNNLNSFAKHLEKMPYHEIKLYYFFH